MEYLILRHKDKTERRHLFSLIGEFFANEEIRKEFTRAMSSDDTYTWTVAMDGDEVAAFGALRIDGSKAELRHDWTVPAYRLQGINRKLVDMRIVLAKQSGVKKIVTTIAPERAAKYPPEFKPVRRNGRWLTIAMEIA